MYKKCKGNRFKNVENTKDNIQPWGTHASANGKQEIYASLINKAHMIRSITKQHTEFQITSVNGILSFSWQKM